MSDYTPSTNEVRETWADYVGKYYQGAYQEFDRWLASVKAEAWDEGAESAYYDPEYRDQVNYPDNPYRKER